MKVFFLTEGGSRFGFGHITRCFAIYQAFLMKGIKPKFIINGDETLNDYLKMFEYDLFDWVSYETRLLEIIQSSDIVIIDTLYADMNLINKIISATKVPVFIDDFRRLKYSNGLVIDWNTYAEENFSGNDNVTYLLGTHYVALRQAFWEVLPKIVTAELSEIVIIMGGSDVRNLTPKILEVFRDVNIIKNVIVGNGYKNKEEIIDLAVIDKTINICFNPTDDDIVKIFCKSDIAISASGQTICELARTGTPTIAVSIIDNQKYGIEGWLKAQFIDFAGNWDDENILNNIKDLYYKLSNNVDARKEKSMIGQKFVDGKGSNRIVETLINLAN